MQMTQSQFSSFFLVLSWCMIRKQQLVLKIAQLLVNLVNSETESKIMRNKSILLLGDYLVEFVEGKVLVGLSCVQNVGVVHHFGNLLVIHGLAEFSGYCLHLLEIYEPLVLSVVKCKQFSKSIFGLGVPEPAADNLQKLLEIQGSVLSLQVGYHKEDHIVTAVQPELLQNFLDFRRVDGSPVVLIEQVESGLELLYVMLRQSVSRVQGRLGDLGGGRFRLGSLHSSQFLFKLLLKALTNLQIQLTMSDEPEPVPVESEPVPEKTAQQLAEEQRVRQQQQKAREQERKRLEQEARVKEQEDIRKLDQALKGSLSGLAKTADNTSMTYVRLTLAEKELERVFSSILRYRQVLHLDISTNSISNVSILAEFPNLLTLNVSKNQIPDLSAFSSQEKLLKLQFLNISGNKIKQLTGVALPALRRLNLSQNQITGVRDWKGHSSLVILELRKNKLRKLKGISNMKNLQQLYANENQITDIRGLQNLPSLVKLSVRNNKIKSIISPFPYLPSLVHLNMRENQISSIKQLRKVDEYVCSVNILANPVSDQLGENLKKEIIWTMPHFTKINKSVVTQQQRATFQKERLEKLAQQERQRLEKQQQARRQEEARKAAEQPEQPPQQ